MLDPWMHRSVGMKCTSCMWFVAKVPESTAPMRELDEKGMLGRCRRHAPSMNGYPVVFAADWCGDHKLDEAKYY
jgi:hypothetical protein